MLPQTEPAEEEEEEETKLGAHLRPEERSFATLKMTTRVCCDGCHFALQILGQLETCTPQPGAADEWKEDG